MSQAKKPVKQAFSKLTESLIVKHVRSVIWVLVKTVPTSKFVPYYRYAVPHPRIQEEVKRRCLYGMQPRTFYIAKACRSTDQQVYLAQPLEISFTRSKFNSPLIPDVDNYSVTDFIKDSYLTIPHNKKHHMTDVLAFRCASDSFDEDELYDLFERENLFTLPAKWEHIE